MGKDSEKPENKQEINLDETSLDVMGDARGSTKDEDVNLADTAQDLQTMDVNTPPDQENDDLPPLEEVTLGKILADLEDTSLDLGAMSQDVPSSGIVDSKTDKHEKQEIKTPNINLAETDEFAMEKLDDDESVSPEEESAGEGDDEEEDSKFHRPASILDLIKGKDEAMPVVAYEDADLDKRLEGKSLDEVLKISQKDEGDWHESEIAKEGLKELAAAAKSRQRKLFIIAPLLLLAAGVLCFYIILPTFNPPPETDAIKLPKRKKKVISAEKLKIDPNEKDVAKLEKYSQMAKKMFDKKKYDKAEIIYRKLLPTGWQSQEILARLGECRDKLGDKKGAADFYAKALSKDYTGDVAIPLRLATILQEDNKYQEILNAIEPVQDKFFTNIPLQSLMAETYWKLGMPHETLKTYRRINKQFLNEDQLKVFAELLLKENDTKAAFNVYLFLAQNFNDLPSFYQASKLAPNPKLRIAVLTELSGKSMGTPKWNYYNLLLGEAIFAQGKKKDALRVFEAIKPEKLDTDNALKFLKLISNFDHSISLVESCERIMSKKFLKNLAVQEEIRDILLANNKHSLALKLFKQQALKHSQSDIANYMYASVANDNATKFKYYEKALVLNPDFYSVSMALGKLYCDESSWDEAMIKFNKCVKLKPKARAPWYWIAIVRIRQTEDDASLGEFAKFLDSINTPEKSKLKQLINLAQYLPTDAKAMEYLKQMEKFPSLKRYMDLQVIRTKLIYGTLKSSDFIGRLTPGIKKYRILFLLGEGKINEVMMLPTLRNEFPEFWKVFICWRKNIASWKENSQLLVSRNPDNNLYALCVKLWNWEISQAEAEKQIGLLNFKERPLFFFMIAERYRRDGNKVKASIFYQTALKSRPPNIYKGVVKYFKDH